MAINTVLGPVSPDALGLTLTAEHFYFQTHGGQGRFLTMLLDDEVPQTNRRVQGCGGGCIVDDTPPCAGRYPARLSELRDDRAFTS